MITLGLNVDQIRLKEQKESNPPERKEYRLIQHFASPLGDTKTNQLDSGLQSTEGSHSLQHHHHTTHR